MRLIDADILERSLTEIDEHINMDIFTNEVRELIDNAPTVEGIPKDQYETRLKADMVNMLEELDFRLSNYQGTDLLRQDIQEKINKLKGEEDGNK